MGGATENINAALSSITGALVGQLDLKALPNTIVEETMKLLNAEACQVFIEDDEKGPPRTITMRAGTGLGQDLINQISYVWGEGLTGYIFKTGTTFVVQGLDEIKNLRDEHTGENIWKGKQYHKVWESGGREFRNLIGLPLKIRDKILGVIKVENKLQSVSNAFTHEDVMLLQTISNVISLAIENAVLFQKSGDQVKAISTEAARNLNEQCGEYDAILCRIRRSLHGQAAGDTALEQALDHLQKTTQNVKSLISDLQRDIEQTVRTGRRTCFVIMPFSGTAACQEAEWTAVFREMIKPAVEESGLDYVCTRSDLKAGNIVKGILSNLDEADVVIADITDLNPNVFYELGIRHTLKEYTILITQDMSSIPFDLSSYATIEYRWRTQEDKDRFAQSVKEVLSRFESRRGEDICTSPVLEYLSGVRKGR